MMAPVAVLVNVLVPVTPSVPPTVTLFVTFNLENTTCPEPLAINRKLLLVVLVCIVLLVNVMLPLLNVIAYTLFQYNGPVDDPKLYVLVVAGIKPELILAVTVSVLPLFVPMITSPFKPLVPEPINVVVLKLVVLILVAVVVLTYVVPQRRGVVLLPKSYELVTLGKILLPTSAPNVTVS